MFTRSNNDPHLFYINESDRRIAFLTTTKQSNPPSGLDTALAEEGRFLLLSEPVADEAQAEQNLVTAARFHLAARAYQDARFVWFNNSTNVCGQTLPGYWDGGVWRTSRVTVFDFGNLALLIGKNCAITLDNDTVIITPQEPEHMQWIANYGMARLNVITGPIRLPLRNQNAGCLCMNVMLDQDALEMLDVGLRLFYPPTDPAFRWPKSGADFLDSIRFPVFDLSTPPNLTLDIEAVIDPLNLHSEKCAWLFTDLTQQIPTCYLTNLGHTVYLTPTANSRFVFEAAPHSHPARSAPLYLVPAGDFAVTMPEGNYGLMCGLAGLEYIKPERSELSNCLMRFIPGCDAAFSEQMRNPPKTAWCSLAGTKPNGSFYYYAQPDDAVLYHHPDQSHFLKYLEVPAGILPDDLPLPLFPYAGLTDITTAVEQELAVRRKRRQVVHQHNQAITQSDPSLITGTTPQGLLATFSGDYKMLNKLLLAVNSSGTIQEANQEITLNRIEWGTELRTALQSSPLFLVISDPGDPKVLEFGNYTQLLMSGWTFDLDPEKWTRNGTVLIFKYHPQALIDLIQDTENWAFADHFNGNKASQVRRKLVQFVEQLKNETDPLYDDLKDIFGMSNEKERRAWTGIIALNVAVLPDNLPDELKALAGGIDEKRFFARCVGIQVTPVTVEGTALIPQSSSLFALIDYQKKYQARTDSDCYDFQVTKLRVLFENSMIKDFSAELVVRMDELFGETATLIQKSNELPASNLIYLTGRAEKHDGHTAYTFSFQGNNRFKLSETGVLEDVTIIKAAFTSDPAPAGKPPAGRFLFWGRLNFRCQAAFDVLSFGEPKDSSGIETPLSFANLALSVNYEPGSIIPKLTFDPRFLTFDLKHSRARSDSLYNQFPLRADKILCSDNRSTLTSQGYMLVTTPLGKFELESGDPWYGLAFNLELGSVGALAGQSGLVFGLIAAWNPYKNKIAVGLKLPGSSGGKSEFTIQGVLKITFESAVLYKNDHNAYQLKLRNIMLKCLMLSFPPNAQTEIIVFGDPDAGASDTKTLGWYAAYATTK